MKGKKLAGILTIGMSCAMLLTGCTFSGMMDNLVSRVADPARESVVSSSSEEGSLVSIKTFDTSLDAPVFTQNLGSISNTTIGGTVILQAAASVNDGGTVTYQWYSNNVDSNGGGTKIEGAVDAVYMPDTAEGGTTFYYVVAINDHGTSINETTSVTQQVTVWENMYWQQNADNGGYQYLSHEDGSYPTNCTMEVDGVSYTFNDSGFAVDPETGDYVNITTGEIVQSAEAETPAEEPVQEETEESAEESEAVDAEAVEPESVEEETAE